MDHPVVFLEDDPMLRQALADVAPSFGIEPLVCESLGQVIDHLGQRGPITVVSDLRMPVIDGVRALTAVRHTFPDARLVLLTGYSPTEEEQWALRTIEADIFSKVAGLSDLFASLGEELSGGVPQQRPTLATLLDSGRLVEASSTLTGPSVFLCHGSEDKHRIRVLYSWLSLLGARPWLDEDDILPGLEWETEIRKAAKEADIFLICLSQTSVNKQGYVQKEIRLALEIALEKPAGMIYLIPARLDDCPVPESIGTRQWVDLFEEGGYFRLVQALRHGALQRGLVFDPNQDRVATSIAELTPVFLAQDLRVLIQAISNAGGMLREYLAVVTWPAVSAVLQSDTAPIDCVERVAALHLESFFESRSSFREAMPSILETLHKRFPLASQMRPLLGAYDQVTLRSLAGSFHRR